MTRGHRVPGELVQPPGSDMLDASSCEDRKQLIRTLTLMKTDRRRNSKAAQAQKRHDAILEAAWKLFLERDYASVSMDDIIRSSGGSKATLYKQFGNKEGILTAVIDRLAKQMIEGIRVPKLMGIPPREALRRFGLHLGSLALSDMAVRQHQLAVANAIELPALARLWFENGPDQTMNGLADYLSGEAKAGRLKIKDPARAAHMFGGMVLFYHNMRLLVGLPHPSQAEIKGIVNEAVNMFLQHYQA